VSSVRAASAGRPLLPARHAPAAATWAISLAAWGVLALGAGGAPLLAFCSATGLLNRPPAASLSLALALDPPATLAAGWALMIAAMMSPLTAGPLQHVSERSFAARRWRSMLLFAAGYGVAWMAAGVALEAVVIAARLAAPHGWLPFALATAVALVWQVSPAKQRCLNGCHRRPPLAAFGLAADRDALRYGLTHGGWCLGACWALMLPPLLLAHGHLAAMAAVALFLFAERFERPAPPAWRWRGPGRALRIALAQARMRLQRA
jgi:predicted metal-binding membrane protein